MSRIGIFLNRLTLTGRSSFGYRSREEVHKLCDTIFEGDEGISLELHPMRAFVSTCFSFFRHSFIPLQAMERAADRNE